MKVVEGKGASEVVEEVVKVKKGIPKREKFSTKTLEELTELPINHERRVSTTTKNDGNEEVKESVIVPPE